jgi:hypothetical protein
MSVSFSPTEDFNQPYRHVCSCGDYWGPTFNSFNEAHAQRGFYKSHCRDQQCQMYPMYVQAVDATPEMNVSNTNAVTILDALDIRQGEDFSDRCSGVMPATEFAERVLLARAASVADAGVPAYRDGNVIHYGRSKGYIEEALDRLADIADYAVTAKLDVHWG